MANWSTVTTLINLDGGLLDGLHTRHCVNQKQRRIIEELPSSCGKQKLLEIVTRKSQSAFDSFLVCLEVTKQHQVLHLIKNNAGWFNNIVIFSRLPVHSALSFSL
jgi:hypothetical protein